MENKYFTPDIEDLYVGYKLEIKGPHDVDWQPVVLGKDAIWHQFTNLENLGQAMEQLRVPYLTKEDIEDEGWIKAKAPIITIKHDFYEIPYIKDNFRVDYNFRNNLINIIENNGENLFKGKCKCINEFRKIIKLLEI